MSKNVLMLATQGFAELVESRARLIAVGATVQLASLDTQPISGLEWDAVGQLMSQTSVTPDLAIADVELAAFDALVLPGGLRNPDTLPVVVDGRVITSRMPEDIPVFVDAVLAALEGVGP